MKSALIVGSIVALCACGTAHNAGQSAGQDTPPASPSFTASDAGSNASVSASSGGSLVSDAAAEAAPSCADGGINDEGCPCTAGAMQKCFVGDPSQAGVGTCYWGTQTCMGGSSTENSVATWGACTGYGTPSPEVCNGIDDNCNGLIDEGVTPTDGGLCATACDAPPPSLGGYKVVFDSTSSDWSIETDANGNPIRVDGSVNTTQTCTIQVQQETSSSPTAVVVPTSAKEVFFQLVGAGAGGGRYYDPPSTGGGAGAFIAGTIDVSGSPTPVTLTVQIGGGGGIVGAGCNEDTCPNHCTCPRGDGTAGGASTILVNGATITANGGSAGSSGYSPIPGGTFTVAGSAAPAIINVNTVQSQPGGAGDPGCGNGCSGPGGSPSCSWGSGAATTESGAGNGAGGGGGNNEPAGVGADGVAILMWVQCTP